MYRSNITIWSWWFIFTFRLIAKTWIRYSSLVFLMERIWFCYISYTMIFGLLLNFRTSVVLVWPIYYICVSLSKTLILILPLFGLQELTVCDVLGIWRHSLFWLRGIIRFLWDWLICLFFNSNFSFTSLIEFLWLFNRLRYLICWWILLCLVLKSWLVGSLASWSRNI